MSWNYRVVDYGSHVAVHEVYYTDGVITHWAPAPRALTGDTVGDIAEDLELIAAQLRKHPPLFESEMPK